MSFANSLFSYGDVLEDYVNTKVFSQRSYVTHNDPKTGAPRTSPPLNPMQASVGSISVPSPLAKENIVTINPSGDSSRAAGLLAGQSGMVLAPLGRQGAGGLGSTPLLGR